MYCPPKKSWKKGEGNKVQINDIETNSKMVDLNPIASIITLNINGLNIMIKRQRLSDWINRQNPTIRSLQTIHEEKADKTYMKNWPRQNLVGDLNIPLGNWQKEKIKNQQEYELAEQHCKHLKNPCDLGLGKYFFHVTQHYLEKN